MNTPYAIEVTPNGTLWRVSIKLASSEVNFLYLTEVEAESAKTFFAHAIVKSLDAWTSIRTK